MTILWRGVATNTKSSLELRPSPSANPALDLRSNLFESEIAAVIARYTRPEMRELWSDETKFRCWLEVEATASEVLAEAGIVPAEAAKAIRERGNFDVERIRAVEAETRHDVIAFTTAVAEYVGPESRWLHYGLTSTDVVDTAQALQVKAASTILREDLL